MNYYSFLDGLRAISILLVIGHHLNVSFNMKIILGSLYAWASVPMRLGFLGVDIFFVISGFLITGLLVQEDSKPNIPRFYIRRFFKIIPSYLAVILLTYLVFAFMGEADTSKYSMMNYLLMIQNYTHIYAPLGHLWSIAVEEHFYIIYPIFIYLIYSISDNNPTIFRRNLIKAILILIFLVIFIRFFSFLFDPLQAPWPWQKTHVRFDALLAGGVLKCLEPDLPKDKYRRTVYSWVVLIPAGIFLISLLSMSSSSMQYLDYCKAYLLAALIITSCLLQQNFLNKLLSFKFLRWIGRNSYGIYLWHYPILLFFRKIPNMALDRWETVVLYLILAIAAGVLSTATLEKYFLNLRERFDYV
ncbi:MAG: acyltransferase [Candidatus Omnitrophica bacterium]|nr:acyltransferase [Candidatus Omnitrophota bacterium]